MGLKSEVAVNSRPGRAGRNKTEPLVKQIIEATRCTNAEAEEALQENQNDIELAVLWLLDRGESVWTEQKSRKAKKDEVERPVRPNKRNGPKGAPNSTVTSGTAPTSGVTGNRSNNENRRPREGRPEREPRENREPRPPRADREPRGERQERSERPEGAKSGFGRPNRNGPRQNRENGNKPEDSTQIVEDNKPAKPVNSIWGGKSSFAEKVAGSKKPAIDKFDSPALSEQPVTQTEGKPSGAWAAGQVYTRTNAPATNPADVPGAPAPVKPEPMKNAAGPLSFAAILQKKPAPVVKPVEIPVESTQASTAAAPQTSATVADPSEAPSTFTPDPSPQPTPVKPAVADEVPAAVPETSAAHAVPDVNTVSQSLTSQLKNDLGLSSSSQASAASASPLISAAPTSSTATPVNAGRGTVEFVSSDLNSSTKSHSYQFGYNPEPTPAPVVIPDEPAYKPTPPVAEVVTTAAQPDYTRQIDFQSLYKAPVESTPSPSKPIVNAAAQLANSYGIPQQQPQQQSLQQQQQQQQLQQHSMPRRLGYAETSTVSFQPENRSALPAVTTVPTAAPTHKAPVTAQSAVNHPAMLHQQHTSQQQQMYNPPMYNAGFPYALYSPVAGREDQHAYAAPPYMPYYGMDINLAQVLPPMHLAAQVHSHHQQQQQQASQQSAHRSDQHHGYDLKNAYGQQPQQNSNTNSSSLSASNPRESNLSSNQPVAPPPGFASHPTNPNVFNQMFQMQQFMQPKVGHMYQQGVEDSMDLRQQHQSKIYGQQQDKYSAGGNVRDRLNIGAAQPTPPPQASYQQYGSNINSVLNSKKPYSHGQWNN